MPGGICSSCLNQGIVCEHNRIRQVYEVSDAELAFTDKSTLKRKGALNLRTAILSLHKVGG